jgi:hypothetical protein
MAAKATMRVAGESPAGASDAPVEIGSSGIVTVTDSKGRSIGLRQLTVVEEMRLLKVLGEYNPSYYNFCSQVARVTEIDGQKIHLPNNEREIEALAARLGKEGVAALMGSIVDAAEASEDKEREILKK